MKYVYSAIALMAVMSLVSFFSMGIDKRKSRIAARRIPEKRLFLFAALGGGVGGWLGMRVFHHKTKHWYFVVFFPLFALAQIGGCIYLYYLLH